MTPAQLLALDQIAHAAVACEAACGCPAALSAAQAGLESAWLSRMSGTNNCFGIKSTAAIPGRELVPTHEWFTPAELEHFLCGDGRTAVPATPPQQHGARTLYNVRDWFAAFDSLADCFAFHGGLLQRGVYAPAWKIYQFDADFPKYVGAIAAHYATDPHYSESVLAIASGANVAKAIAAARTA